MYEGGLHCLSFHYRKHLPIGEGGMILTDNQEHAQWLRAARYCGRRAPDYAVEDVSMIGWQCYMSVEKAARGLAHMQWIRDDLPDQQIDYPDLRKVKAFHAYEQERLLERV
jgi:dTDP-4-amino-4,6-dideoxygalactose transaminase